MTTPQRESNSGDGIHDPLMSLVLDYGEVSANAARAAALGDELEARQASHDSYRLLVDIFELREAEQTEPRAGARRPSDG